MKTMISCLALLLALAVCPRPALGLSVAIGRDIHFPKNFDPQKAETLRKVIRQGKFNFVGGIVSHWDPDYGTRLSFKGDAANLTEFLSDLRGLKGFSLRLILYKGRDDERRRDSAWQLDFSHARPGQVTVYLNLNSSDLDFYKIKFPEWPAP